MKNKNFNYKTSGSFGSTLTKNKKALIIVAIILAVLIIAATVVAIVLAVKKKNEEKHAMDITSIAVTHVPHKTTYYVGEIFDIEGLRVFSNRKGGAFIEVDIDDCTVTGFNSSAVAEKQTITVRYKEFVATFAVEIKAPPSLVPVLESISIETLPKTEYKLGEGYSGKGGVILCKYTDGTTKTTELRNEYISGFRAAYLAGVGEYDITVTYTENGIQAQTTYKITITE